jgi:hypothetical protein
LESALAEAGSPRRPRPRARSSEEDKISDGLSPSYGVEEVALDGFAGEMSPTEFVDFFARTHGCTSLSEATRIEFRYVEGSDD